MESFCIGEAIKVGWEKFKAHYLFMWIIFGVTIGVSIFFNLLQHGVDKNSFAHLVITLLSVATGITLQLWLIRAYLDLIDLDKEGEVKALFVHYRLMWRYLGAAILYGIIVVLGLIALIVPGIYFALKYQFYAYLIVDKNLDVFGALKKSAEMTQGVKWKLFGFLLVLVGVNILGAIALLVGLLVTVPMSILAYVFVYRALSKRLLAPEAAAPSQPTLAPAA